MTRLRIATFNLENLDHGPGRGPELADRIALLRPELVRLEADILCLQEVNAQAGPEKSRTLIALDALLADTVYAGYRRAVTTSDAGPRYRDVANLVTLSRFPIRESRQVHNDLVPPPHYRPVTAAPPPEDDAVTWDRPFLLTTVDCGGKPLHVFNLHLKAPLAAFIPGQKESAFSWKSVPAWAEGYFLASLKRAGQALEVRMSVDTLFDDDAAAHVVVCGDFNAESNEVPLITIRADVQEVGNGRLAYRALVAAERRVPESERYTVRHLGEKVMLDHLLVSRPLVAYLRDVQVHNEMLTDELAAFYSGRRDPESFHAPVLAEFDMPG